VWTTECGGYAPTSPKLRIVATVSPARNPETRKTAKHAAVSRFLRSCQSSSRENRTPEEVVGIPQSQGKTLLLTQRALERPLPLKNAIPRIKERFRRSAV
jgi:hypothetical protein